MGSTNETLIERVFIGIVCLNELYKIHEMKENLT